MKRNGGRLCFCVRMVAKKILQTTKMITQKPFCANSVFGCFLSHGGTPSHHPFYSGFSMKNIPILGVPHFMLSNEASAPWDRNWDSHEPFFVAHCGGKRLACVGSCAKSTAIRTGGPGSPGFSWSPKFGYPNATMGFNTKSCSFLTLMIWGTPILGTSN